jgi:flagellar hook-associated protein 2
MAVNTSGISFSGLASGLDSGKLIQQLVALEGLPIKQLEAQKSTFQSKLSAVGTLKGLVKDLQTQADILSKKSSLLSYFTSVSQDGHLAASASGSASPGTHTVTVNQLATIDRWTFDPVADKTVDLATQDGQHVAFTVDGTNYDVVLTAATSSLEDVAAAINSVAGADVAASVVNVGTSAAPSYQLVMTSKHSGESNRISGIVNTVAGLTIDPTPPGTGGLPGSANNITVGMNAEAVIDGLTVVRETNEFNDVVAGLSLTVQSADPLTQLSVSVAADTGSIKTKIKDFVASFNKLIDYVNTQNTYNKEQDQGGMLFGDPILRQVVDRVRDGLFDFDPAVVQADTEGFSTLSLVGLKTQNDGTIKIDESVLDDKIADNLDKLADLFVDTDGFDNGGAAENTPGFYIDLTPDSGVADKLSRAIDRMLDTYNGPGGKVYKGIFDARAESYNKSINKLFKDIAAKQVQVDKFEDMLVMKFAGLEKLMGGLQSQGAALAVSVANLGGGG